MAPKALGGVSPEERHRLYRLLRLKVAVSPSPEPRSEWGFGNGVCTSRNGTNLLTKPFHPKASLALYVHSLPYGLGQSQPSRVDLSPGSSVPTRKGTTPYDLACSYVVPVANYTIF